ncbi:retrograde regulation protein 2 [Rhizodiscina lignyota]|uniref:Retrograde regulation protein 2 n=1 Tax=Rhizodiscina lignyota TaxID=1504668 RepID=A0A9P4IUH4_9PEZI|nr:retrograde regulation protein 2 [Rhizodiscina lignyota]
MDEKRIEATHPGEPEVAPTPDSRDIPIEISPDKLESLQKEKNAVIRKLDWRLMPLIFVLYSLSVLDRSNLGNARLAGLVQDIDLTGRRYDWLATVFYIAYILSQWMTIGWKAFKPHHWAAFAVFVWGFVSTIQAAVTSWAGLMTCRVFLGIIEACYGPGVPLYLSYFYPRERLGFRVGFFLSGSALANAYGGALAYGISQARGSIAPWQILFIVEGVPTCVLAVFAFFWLPDSPETCTFLSEREREIAIAISQQQPGDRSGKKGLDSKQLLASLMDPRSYLPGLCYFGANICFASLPLFVPTIISQMGAFTSIQSQGLSAPPYLLTFFVICFIAWVSDKVNFRGPFVAGFGLVGAVGYIILGTTTGVGPRYFGLFLAAMIFTSVAQLLVWVGNTHATDSKRAGGLAILATFGQCGPVLGTNVFPTTDAPYYRKGMWVSCGGCLIVFVCGTIQSICLYLENRHLDKKYGKVEKGAAQHFEVTTKDGTDPRFRYVI